MALQLHTLGDITIQYSRSRYNSRHTLKSHYKPPLSLFAQSVCAQLKRCINIDVRFQILALVELRATLAMVRSMEGGHGRCEHLIWWSVGSIDARVVERFFC